MQGIPLVQPGDQLAELIQQALEQESIALRDGDILVLAQKIVSKAENRYANLDEVKPTPRASEIAALTEKDARLVQLILDESREVVRALPGLLIVEHRLGFISANAGIDHSNVEASEKRVLLLPKDPDLSAAQIRQGLEGASGVRLGVLIIDSHGRAWRQGTLGVTIGLSGLPGLQDLRGRPDLFGNELRITQVAVADELAAAASLLMGQADENCPAVHVRGFPYSLRESSLGELLRPKDQDAFR
ncbi:MAG: coenzyme F420-0:L-glutamate ligase [Chloroflexi bacterium]|nr:coenzyme F420-0:L-glutamate ligase [Chloroflexota bacterium]